MNERLIVIGIAIWAIILLLLILKNRDKIEKLEKIVKNSAIWLKLPDKELIPVDKPFITENGADNRLEKIEEELNDMKDILDKVTTFQRNMKIRVTNPDTKLDDKELKALSNALDKRDHKQGKQIESNTQRMVSIEKELKEMGKRLR